MHTFDALDRPLRSLRVSVTDRCNIRCQYCMPERDYVWLPRHDLLSFEEIERLVEVFVSLGVDRLRLTGGEPLLRKDLPALVRALAAKSGLTDLALTTNGVLLAAQAQALRDAGLHRVTISLDTLRSDRFRALTGSGGHQAILEGIAGAVRAGFQTLKIDTVVMRGVNDDELFDLIEFGRSVGAEVRFIEYMDVGGATRWSMDKVVSRSRILELVAGHYGPLEPPSDYDAPPADRFTLPDGTVFGVISSTTEPFCRRCDRSRLTADGMWYLCLYATQGIDLRAALRGGTSPDEIRRLVSSRWEARTDRGAELRREANERLPYLAVSELRKDAHLEMHTRGG